MCAGRIKMFTCQHERFSFIKYMFIEAASSLIRRRNELPEKRRKKTISTQLPSTSGYVHCIPISRLWSRSLKINAEKTAQRGRGVPLHREDFGISMKGIDRKMPREMTKDIGLTLVKGTENGRVRIRSKPAGQITSNLIVVSPCTRVADAKSKKLWTARHGLSTRLWATDLGDLQRFENYFNSEAFWNCPD